ncbi:MAG: hypothetical protein OEW11_03635 [Nitrospirota bacterium]|nr:hypothetical protein [Nitrospirota bacterium]
MQPDTTRDILCAAITQRRLVELSYAGRPVRMAPHAVFRSAGGHPLVTGVVEGGKEEAGGGFKNFDLRNVGSVTVLETRFTPDPTFDPTARRFRFGLECGVVAG